MTITGLPITGLYAGILGLFVIPLSIHVILNRYRAKIGIFDGGDEQLGKAMRIHGNFTEHVPLALILMILAEVNGSGPEMMHTLGLILLGSRLFHVYGLSMSAGPSVGRFVGVMGTWAVIAGSGGYCVARFIGF
ncbi:MAG: hypothetical protein HON65_16780 [Rhodospirillales bacterium]|jgi:uncharacterized protein|nr:hypothetical protein [Rhodospirillales bacterium]